MIYNIIYNKEIALDILEQSLQSANATIVNSFPSLGVLTIDTNSEDFKTVSGVLNWEEDSQIQATPQTWHKNRIYTSTLPMSDIYYPSNLGEGKTIYVIDSGLYTGHSEFTGRNIELLYSYDDTITDELGHGTSITSLIVGNTLGVTPNATVKVVKIPMLQTITISSLLAAFDAVLADHLLSSTPKVVNCSWTITKSQILDTKIAELQQAGLVVVAAAGNNGQAADNYSPVGLDSVLGVAASDAYDRVISWATGTSNWGPEVDITAPGINVQVAQLDGTISTSSGTSLAAAIVSAVVAQYMVESPAATAEQIQQIIVEQARQDLLFRNESVYGTTPNKLIAGSAVNDIFILQDNLIKVKRGETAQQQLLYREELVADINVDGVMIIGLRRINAEWMSYNKETKMIQVSPPADLTPGIYRMYFEAYDVAGNRISTAPFRISVYENSPEENEQPETPEMYFTVDGGHVVVVPAACSTNFCMNSGSCSGTPDSPQKGAFCGCPPPSPLGTFCGTRTANQT